MEESKIRSRKPIHPGRSGNYSPGSPGSPIRRQLSPNFSGSDGDEETEQEPLTLEAYHPDNTASTNTTINSSPDVADGNNVKYSYSERNRTVDYYPNGNVRRMNEIKVNQNIVIVNKDAPRNYVLWSIASIVMLGLFGILYYVTYHNNVAAESSIQLIRCSFELSEKEFPNQNKILWKSLEHGVESVLNEIPTKPSIFLLAYDDASSVNKITRSIVQRTTECLNSKVNALELSPEDLEYNEMKVDYGVVIAKYRNQLGNSGVMLVNDLNKVPSKVAQAFHVFCDVQNPLVDRSIIFLTLQLNREIHSNINPLRLVENYLRSNWSELASNILDPLIVRVTDQVFLLNNE